VFAIEKLIEEETLAEERLVGRWEWPGRLGYLEGVFPTWARIWRRSERAADRSGAGTGWLTPPCLYVGSLRKPFCGFLRPFPVRFAMVLGGSSARAAGACGKS
jgi:hypothetical protein